MSTSTGAIESTTPSPVTTANRTELQEEKNPRSPLPVLLVGHGSRDPQGRQAILDLAAAYAQFDLSRPVIPCFLELTEPTIADGVAECDRLGLHEAVALPVLLFGARHNKFDITNELDALQRQHPHMTFYYGAPMGISTDLLDLLRQRLAQVEAGLPPLPKQDTVLLFVGRGSSDPEANSEAYKLARLLWEGSGYRSVEICFVGITHPRLEAGFDRALSFQPRRILVVPYFLFTGVLVKKIQAATVARDRAHPDVEMVCLPELGIAPAVLQSLYRREREAQAGEVRMNCHLCKFRIAASEALSPGALHHHHNLSSHSHGPHRHDCDGEAVVDPYAAPIHYHQRVWQLP
ncbi:sirohydrochlorin chelatase [Synechococcus sp. PCC 7336]|uniref:sirohydrochlorin chelatase n=1 Tax=Synechococcus sp. PCC 7336 TaxID=195250 RepID=UPI00034D855D|nr:sirohydrochlorin chelatase [Synechococcus sp. PCC 7336]